MNNNGLKVLFLLIIMLLSSCNRLSFHSSYAKRQYNLIEKSIGDKDTTYKNIFFTRVINMEMPLFAEESIWIHPEDPNMSAISKFSFDKNNPTRKIILFSFGDSFSKGNIAIALGLAKSLSKKDHLKFGIDFYFVNKFSEDNLEFLNKILSGKHNKISQLICVNLLNPQSEIEVKKDLDNTFLQKLIAFQGKLKVLTTSKRDNLEDEKDFFKNAGKMLVRLVEDEKSF